MPHPDYTLDRDLSGALARDTIAATYLTRWYQSNNPDEALAALRMSATMALRNTGENGPTPAERQAFGVLLSDLATLTAP